MAYNKDCDSKPLGNLKKRVRTPVSYTHLKMSLEELQTYPILMLDKKSTTSEFLHSMFQKHQLDLVPEIELSSNDLLIDLAKIGLGIAFVPDFCIPVSYTHLKSLSLVTRSLVPIL